MALKTIVYEAPLSHSDTSKTFFKDRLFILENDTLYELMGRIGNRSGTKYIASDKH